MIPEQALKQKLDEMKRDLVELTIKLISEDSPKNKFSIVSGKMQMIDEVQSIIDDLVRSQRES